MQDNINFPTGGDSPVPSYPTTERWGSDVIAELLRDLDIPYVVLNPGASFRGLHDSLVNHLGNRRPQMLVVLHEEHAVAIAHGFAKVAGRPLAAILHSNVGLMHASMAIYNAFTDRVPVLVLGATGPVDASKRRPWIDWLHTSQDQGALVRHFVKWDAQAISVPGAQEALLRAALIAKTAPKGPVYVCLDTVLQETRIEGEPARPDVSRFDPGIGAEPPRREMEKAASILSRARKPVILVGRVSRDEVDWRERVVLAERLGAQVITDLKVGASFPTTHPLHPLPPSFFLAPAAQAALRAADVVLSLDWVDLGGTLKQAFGRDAVTCKVIHVSIDQYVHNGWSMDHQTLAPVDIALLSEPAPAVRLLEAAIDRDERGHEPAVERTALGAPTTTESSISIAAVAQALKQSTAGREVCLIRLPLGWSGELWDFEHPLDYLGHDGGGGIGSGPGMAVGAALALRGTGRLPVAVLGDGDFMMGLNALWTAARAAIPLLIIVCNNRSFFNDEIHQQRVAEDRGRPVENAWIGQRISDPEPDLAMLARGQGLIGIGPIDAGVDLLPALADGVRSLLAGRSVVIDVHVKPGYSPAMASGMTRTD